LSTLYLSGPMSGMPDLNFPTFNAETARLRALGFTVINPVEINPDPDADWLDCIAADIVRMRPADTIAFLPGWEASAGAQVEHIVARRLGMKVVMAADIVDEVAA